MLGRTTFTTCCPRWCWAFIDSSPLQATALPQSNNRQLQTSRRQQMFHIKRMRVRGVRGRGSTLFKNALHRKWQAAVHKWKQYSAKYTIKYVSSNHIVVRIHCRVNLICPGPSEISSNEMFCSDCPYEKVVYMKYTISSVIFQIRLQESGEIKPFSPFSNAVGMSADCAEITSHSTVKGQSNKIPLTAHAPKGAVLLL